MQLNGLVVLGASSDIGHVVAERAARRGVPLLLTSRTSPLPACASAADLTGVDLTRRDDVARLRAAAAAKFDEPFAVVHSVGAFWHHRQFEDVGMTEAQEFIDTHYMTLVGAAMAMFPVMTAVGGGRLIGMSCNSVAFNYPDMAPFTAAKAAVEALLKSLANEYLDRGIATTALALPTIRTPKVAASKPTVDQENYLTPEDVADAVDHVVTLPKYVTGNVMRLVRYSPSFYEKGYFERNPRDGRGGGAAPDM